MSHPLDRRAFLQRAALFSAGLGAGVPALADPQPRFSSGSDTGRSGGDPLYRISLAEWSLNKQLFKRAEPHLDNLDFPGYARSLGIDAVEYVNQFFMDKATDEKYLNELRQRCDDAGVKSLLIMCDREGQLGDPNKQQRIQAVKNHHKWVRAAKGLGCHSIRVNAASSGGYEEQQKLAADGLSRLTDYAAEHGLNVLVENHGGLSSNGEWLADVMKMVGKPRCGTLPDFGNFRLGGGKGDYNRYKGVKELMPFAKAVSAKSHEFSERGDEVHTDYHRMMKIVTDAGYHGYVGIEYEGNQLSAKEGILATKHLLERVREDLSA